MKKLRFISLILTIVLLAGFMWGCTSDFPIRISVDESKTEIAEFECVVTDSLTKEYDETVMKSSYGFMYTGDGVKQGLMQTPTTEHVIEYYLVVTDKEGVSCHFQLDELDYKLYEEGDKITLQKVQEYTKSNEAYKPYYAYKGKKINLVKVT